MSNEDIRKEKIKDIIKQCELEEDMQRMENRYDTLVGEKGVKLSGGQKQRLALARSLISDKPILILDEALNKIDNKTKEKIWKNLMKINKTMIFISNELELLKQVDKIIFIQDHTTFTGKHEELIRKSKEYCRLMEYRKDLIMK